MYIYKDDNMVKKRINITIDEGIVEKFQKYCKERGMKVSTRIELLLKKDMGKNKD